MTNALAPIVRCRSCGFACLVLSVSWVAACGSPSSPDVVEPTSAPSIELAQSEAKKPEPALLDQPIERRMFIVDASASSYLQNDWNRFEENYHPRYSFDDDPNTAWTAELDKPNSDKVPALRAVVGELDHTTSIRLRVRNGYHKSPGLFRKNARAKSVTVTLLPSKAAAAIELADNQEWQEVVVEQPDGVFAGFELATQSTYPGSKYQDLCISDIEIHATSRTVENPEFEQRNHAQLLAWKTARLAAAKEFAKPGLPFFAKYKAQSSTRAGSECGWGKGTHECQLQWLLDQADADPAFAEWEASLALARQSIAELTTAAGFAPVRPAPQEERAIPELDGFSVNGFHNSGLRLPFLGWSAALDVGNLRMVPDEKRSVTLQSLLQHEAPSCSDNLWADPKPPVFAWADSKPVAGRYQTRRVILATCFTEEERDGEYVDARVQIVVYDPDGRLNLTLSNSSISGFRWSGTGAKAKISGGEDLVLWGERTSVAADSRKTVSRR